jgi:hypothetical protein
VNKPDDRKARTSRVADRGLAAVRIPAEDFSGELQAPQHLRAGRQLYAAYRHLEDFRSAGWVEHVRSLEETCKRLAIHAVADKPESGVWCNFIGRAADTTAATAKRKANAHVSVWNSRYNSFVRGVIDETYMCS